MLCFMVGSTFEVETTIDQISVASWFHVDVPCVIAKWLGLRLRRDVLPDTPINLVNHRSCQAKFRPGVVTGVAEAPEKVSIFVWIRKICHFGTQFGP